MNKDETKNIYKYWLPDETGEKKEIETDTNSLIIIGANGSGKSKLGAWIESQNSFKVHRIGAQRNLNFNTNFILRNYEDAQNNMFYGTADENFIKRQDKSYRWDWGKSSTTKLIDDFEISLAAIIGLYNNEASEYLKKCKEAEKSGKEKPKTSSTVIDKLLEIWNEIFPQRNLIFEDSKIFASIGKKSKVEEIYSANQMSDGERSVLYLVAQVLCVPENKIIIIDEPEIHLHNSIMNKLWEKLEEFRGDCFFVYITHNTQFAASHKNANKIWIKEFDGKNWKLETIKDNTLPEKLLFDILGNRKNVLFVEGERESDDTKLYTELFSDYFVVPCGGCDQVILRTKAFNKTEQIHNLKVYGLIDRDFRSDY